MQVGRRFMFRFSPNPNLAHLIHWFEWEDDAFAKAREKDRPVMIFLAAFWCRYCQRMDEEAFSDRENMALLNAYFVSLRMENAKRPDIDARYNLNGWPTIAFLTPNGKLLAAANYLPSDEFKEVLLNVYMEYEQRKDEFRQRVDTSDSAAASRVPSNSLSTATLREITDVVLAIADHVNGGYGSGQKFIQAEANDFLLSRYEATKEPACLDHVCLTLDRMRTSPIYDEKEGGYFRTTTGADWVGPHREKLLAEQAGLLGNCLRLFRITQRPEYARMAEEIIGYLDQKLFDPTKPAFFGCEDFLRRDAGEDATGEEFFAIIDECVYTDANAQAIVAYLEAEAILNRPDHKTRALNVLDFLWRRNRSEHLGMFHYSDDAAHAPRLLSDQARMGIALVQAFRATDETHFLDRAKELAEFILSHLSNPNGGYFDRGESEQEFFGSRLSLIDQNGVAASFFLMLADAAKETKYRDAALWALRAFSGDVATYGIDAALYGQALGGWLSRG
jgi:uncharacterized protein YyaL (SSP411 family)